MRSARQCVNFIYEYINNNILQKIPCYQHLISMVYNQNNYDDETNYTELPNDSSNVSLKTQSDSIKQDQTLPINSKNLDNSIQNSVGDSIQNSVGDSIQDHVQDHNNIEQSNTSTNINIIEADISGCDYPNKNTLNRNNEIHTGNLTTYNDTNKVILDNIDDVNQCYENLTEIKPMPYDLLFNIKGKINGLVKSENNPEYLEPLLENDRQ